MSKTIQFIRCAFKYAYEAGLIDRPVRFGPGFNRPSKKVLRLHRAKQGVKLFTPEEVRKLLDAARVQVRAMILLGINCGFGNSDCGNLPQSAVNLNVGIVDFPRPKTGIPRKCVLWPETVAAIRDALAGRPSPKGMVQTRVTLRAQGNGTFSRRNSWRGQLLASLGRRRCRA